MKFFSILFTAFFLTSASHAMAVEQIKWHTDYENALNVAAQKDKPVLLFFTGSDWCSWCKKLDSEVFNTKEFARQAGDAFVFVKLDNLMHSKQDPKIQQQNGELQKKYHVRNYPQVIILDKNLKQVGETGYRQGGGASYAEHLLRMINNHT